MFASMVILTLSLTSPINPIAFERTSPSRIDAPKHGRASRDRRTQEVEQRSDLDLPMAEMGRYAERCSRKGGAFGGDVVLGSHMEPHAATWSRYLKGKGKSFAGLFSVSVHMRPYLQNSCLGLTCGQPCFQAHWNMK